MGKLAFIKMHGAGNDYVFVDGFSHPLPDQPAELARIISDRHRGVGGDGLILMVPPTSHSCDVEMRMWNADGSRGLMCGNGARCVALWMHLQHHIRQNCRIEIASRVAEAELLHISPDSGFGQIRMNMGAPTTNPCSVVLDLSDRVTEEGAIRQLVGTTVSLGNQHVVVFDQPLTDHNVLTVGRQIQELNQFPDGVNVEWAERTKTNEFRVRVLERGSGETLACGSGACAVGVAAVENGLANRDQNVVIHTLGGKLEVCWQTSGEIQLTGPAQVVFTGEWTL